MTDCKANADGTLYLSKKVCAISTSTLDKTNVTKFVVDSSNPSFKAVDGVLYTKDGTRLGNNSFRNCTDLETVNIPKNITKIETIANLLDNSLNACRKISCSFPRQISVTLFTTELEFVIHISNTTFKEDKCLNTEYEQLYHGYGQKNIAKIVQKYSGVYTNYTENNWYHSIISIPLVVPQK